MADIRVLIVDDHPIICKGIRDLLAPAVGITVVGEAHTGEDALKKIEELGGEILVCAADSASREQMRTVLEQARERFGANHGVIHGAGNGARALREGSAHQLDS